MIIKQAEEFSDRRLVENEVIFKNINESIKAGIEGLFAQAKTDDLPIEFYCECSDLDCRERILLTPKRFTELHSNDRRFMILPGHDYSSIEKVLEDREDYCVVEKFIKPLASTR